MPCLLCEFHAFVDGSPGRNAIKVEQLKRAHSQSDEHFSIDARSRSFQEGLDLLIELNLPAKHAQHERSGQIAVGCGKRVDLSAAQKIVGVRLAALY